MVWLSILGIGVVFYRVWWKPTTEAKRDQEAKEVVDQTSGTSAYKHTVRLGLDGFSGYAILRSPDFTQQLREQGIKLEIADDGADYAARLGGLSDGRMQLAAFPIDALLATSANRKSLPATIVALIDETRGADALLAYKERFPNIDSLNNVSTRFVLVGNSPSETLFRVLLHDFRLDKVSNNSLSLVPTAKDLLDRYRKAQPGGNEVFITWEPFVSQLKANDSMSVLLDSSRQSGYIVDALVVNRDYFIKNEEVVRSFLEAYFRSVYNYNSQSKLLELVRADAIATGTPVTDAQAEELVKGIHWKNTQENLAHFGLVPSGSSLIEDMIDRIKRVLLDTKGIPNDPTEGDSKRLFTERPLREMLDKGYHAGVSAEEIRSGAMLKELSDQQWQQLASVGTLSSPPLIFARSRSTLTEASQATLDELVQKLESWPAYYVKVIGNAGTIGDAEANKNLPTLAHKLLSST